MFCPIDRTLCSVSSATVTHQFSQSRQREHQLTNVRDNLDALDRSILVALEETLRPSVAEVARRVSVARGTVHTRLDRLRAANIIRGFRADLDLSRSGFPVRAFTTVTIAQGQLDQVLAGLTDIPEVLEAHVVTGRGDLLLAVAARSNDDLHGVLQTVASIPQVSELSTQLALASPLIRTVTDLLPTLDPSVDGDG